MARPADPTAPAFIPPMLATLVAAPFDDPDWSFEVKWDGFRVEAIVDGGSVRLWTRGEQDAAAATSARSSIRPRGSTPGRPSSTARSSRSTKGEPDFALLQARIKGKGVAGGADPFVYEVFDLLYLDGRSLLDEPLEVRRQLLADVLRPDPRVRLSEHIEGEGIAFFEAARVRGLEGIMAKDRRSPYLPGARSMAWQKIKIRPEQELVVGGWETGAGSAVDLGALLVGVYEDGALRYAGKVGAGFTNATRAELLAAVAPLAADEPPFDAPVPRPSPRTPTGCDRSSSSAPSSPAGPATAWSARRPTRASNSARTRARSSESGRRPEAARQTGVDSRAQAGTLSTWHT